MTQQQDRSGGVSPLVETRLTDEQVRGLLGEVERLRPAGHHHNPYLEVRYEDHAALCRDVLALREERERLLSISAVMSAAWFERNDATGWGRCRWCDARSFGGHYIVGGEHAEACPVRRLAVLQGKKEA